MTGGHPTYFPESLQAAVMPKKPKRPRRSSSAAFKQAAVDVVASVEHRTGCCCDNAVMERFFWSLKHVWTMFESFDNIAQTKCLPVY